MLVEKIKNFTGKIVIPSLIALPLTFSDCGAEEDKNVIDDPVCMSCAEPSQSCNLEDKYCYANEECLCVNTKEYGRAGVCVEDYYLPNLNKETVFTCYSLVKIDW